MTRLCQQGEWKKTVILLLPFILLPIFLGCTAWKPEEMGVSYPICTDHLPSAKERGERISRNKQKYPVQMQSQLNLKEHNF